MAKQWLPLWVVPATVFFSIGTVWLRLSIIGTTYAIHEMDREIESARKEREKLEVKIAALRSPRRLESLAKSQFRLSTPKMEQMIHMVSEAKGVHGR